jgi:hypothetical protein
VLGDSRIALSLFFAGREKEELGAGDAEQYTKEKSPGHFSG